MKRQLMSGVTLDFEEEGQGPVVVLLHGFPLSRQMWQPQREVLRSTHRLVLPDLRGLGGSNAFQGPPSLSQMADDVAELLDGLRINERVVLGGLSMGGYVALAFVRRHGARLRALVLADTRAEADTADARANRDKMLALVDKEGPKAVIEQMLPKLVAAQTPAERPHVVDTLRKMGQAQTAAGLSNAIEAMRDRPDSTPGLGDIEVPTLVIVGEADAITPPSTAAALATAIPGARLVVIPDAGHMSNLEQPEQFNAALRSFLEQLP